MLAYPDIVTSTSSNPIITICFTLSIFSVPFIPVITLLPNQNITIQMHVRELGFSTATFRFGHSVFVPYLNMELVLVGFLKASDTEFIYYLSADLGDLFVHMVFQGPTWLLDRRLLTIPSCLLSTPLPTASHSPPSRPASASSSTPRSHTTSNASSSRRRRRRNQQMH